MCMKMASVFLEITWFYLNVSEVLPKSVLVAYDISPRLDQKSCLLCQKQVFSEVIDIIESCRIAELEDFLLSVKDIEFII